MLAGSVANKLAGASVLDKHAECRACAYLAYCAPCPASAHQSTGSIEIKPYVDFHCKFTLKLNDWIFDKLENDSTRLMAWWRQDAIRKVINTSSKSS